MNYAARIQAVIDDLKKESNSLERNKMVSHLSDALQYAKNYQAGRVDGIAPKTSQAASQQATSCVCGPGYVDASCPLHGEGGLKIVDHSA